LLSGRPRADVDFSGEYCAVVIPGQILARMRKERQSTAQHESMG
jgi:hypothetical protein